MHPINLKKIIPITLVTLFSYVSSYALDSDDASLDGLTEQLASKAKLTQDLTLCRSASGTAVAHYTDTLSLQNDCKLELSRKTAREQTAMLFELSRKDNNFKSHVTASSIYVYDTEEDKYVRKERAFTTGLGFPGVSSKSDIVIDWASNQSLASAPDLFKRKSNCGNGHSEPQFIQDFNALWTKDSKTVVEHFIPQSTKEKNAAKSVVMCGCNLYGPLDMCDVCLREIVNFRKQHQQGQTSVSQAVRDELKDQFQGNATDAFVVAYHSHCPYKFSTYHAKDETSLYSLGYSTEYRPRKDIFFYKDEEKIDDTYTLCQTKSLPLEKDKVYSYIHLLGGKKVPYMNAQNTFTF